MNLDHYIQGIRKGREINRIEREAMDDPFLAEALEGYDKTTGSHANRILEMQENIAQQTHQKSHTFRYWSMAASILLVIGFGGYFLYNGYFIQEQPPFLEQKIQTSTEIAAIEEIQLEQADSSIVQADSLLVEPIMFTPPVIVKDESASVDLADIHHEPKIIQAETANVGIEKPVLIDTIPTALKESKIELSEIVVSESDEKMGRAKASTTPEPVIGNKAYENYLKKSLIHPSDGECSKVKGKVELSFYINESGRPTRIRVKKSLCQSADAEAIRLVNEGPVWTTGDKEITLDVKF
jgi:hypothetical protein